MTSVSSEVVPCRYKQPVLLEAVSMVSMLSPDYDSMARAQLLTTMLQRAANDGDDISVVDLIRRGADPTGAGTLCFK